MAAVAGLTVTIVAAVQGLTVLYVVAGLVLVIAVLVLARSLGRTEKRRWALSSLALIVLAALIVTPIVLNTSGNPVLAYAPDDGASWMPDGDGGGYVVTTRSIERLDESGEVAWERKASIATWSTPDGIITSDDDRVQSITASGEVAWERTALDLGGDEVAPVAWKEGVTTVSVCDIDDDSQDAWSCVFIGIDAAGAETYTIEADYQSTIYSGGLHHFHNFSGVGAGGPLPSHFGYASPEGADVTVADSAGGHTVTTVPAAGDDVVAPAFAGDRVLTAEMSAEGCTMSAVPIADDSGWTADVPCLKYSDEVQSAPYFDTGLLDGDVLWWRPDSDWLSGKGDLDAVAIDLESGESTPVGEVLWGHRGAGDASEVALAANGLLVEASDSTLSVRDPFSGKTSWTTSLRGDIRTVDASSDVLAVVTKPSRPRLFSSEEDLELTVFALADGRRLETQRWDPDKASHVLPLDDSALLVLDDGTSIRVGR